MTKIQREIKYRAWDPYNKKMWSPEDLSFAGIYLEVDNGQFRLQVDCLNKECLAKRDLSLWDGESDQALSLEPLQYTGLKDKNGKEIYEGDIVKIKSQCMNYYAVGKVKYGRHTLFNEGGYCGQEGLGFYIADPEDESCFINQSEELNMFCTDIEIIGNIYENPELLNDK